MADIAVRRAGDLSESAKSAVEGLLGRALADDEEVSVMALRSHKAPSGPERKAAADRLKVALESMGQKATGVPPEEFEAAVDEAMQQVRPRRP